MVKLDLDGPYRPFPRVPSATWNKIEYSTAGNQNQRPRWSPHVPGLHLAAFPSSLSLRAGLPHAPWSLPSPLPGSPAVEEAEEHYGLGSPVHHSLTVGGDMAGIALIYGGGDRLKELVPNGTFPGCRTG